MYESIQPFSRGISEKSSHRNRNIIFCDDSRTLSIVHIVMDIGDLVRKRTTWPSRVEGFPLVR